MDDVGTLKPTIFVGVPRIFDRIYAGVSEKVRFRWIWSSSRMRCGTVICSEMRVWLPELGAARDVAPSSVDCLCTYDLAMAP